MMSLTLAMHYDVGTDPEAVVAADFNNDGHLDLATANAGSDSVSVLLGSANGTFSPPIDSSAGDSPTSIAVGDFDDDGNLDLAGVSESTNPVVAVMFGDGNGRFLAPTNISLGRLAGPFSDPVSVPMSVAVGDFNEDRLMDIAVASPYNTHYPGYCCGGVESRFQVILAHDDRTFSAPEVAFQSDRAGIESISPLVVTDFNGDGHQDALVGFGAEYVRILLGDGAGNLASASDIDWNIRQGSGMAVGDVNVDGIADLAATDNANINVRLGNGAGGFQPPPYGQSYSAGEGPTGVALGDFDRDGALDVATANDGSNDVSILQGRGDGSFAPPEQFAAGTGTHSLVAADFNGDGWLDVATANATGNSVSVLLNDGIWPPEPALPGDMDFDGDLDFDDLDDFVLGLVDALRYEALHGVAPSANGDMDGDGDLDFDDIPGFVGRLEAATTSRGAASGSATTTARASSNSLGGRLGRPIDRTADEQLGALVEGNSAAGPEGWAGKRMARKLPPPP